MIYFWITGPVETPSGTNVESFEWQALDEAAMRVQWPVGVYEAVEIPRKLKAFERVQNKKIEKDARREAQTAKALERERFMTRDQYVHKVISTLFPDLVITPEQLEDLFPNVE